MSRKPGRVSPAVTIHCVSDRSNCPICGKWSTLMPRPTSNTPSSPTTASCRHRPLPTSINCIGRSSCSSKESSKTSRLSPPRYPPECSDDPDLGGHVCVFIAGVPLSSAIKHKRRCNTSSGCWRWICSPNAAVWNSVRPNGVMVRLKLWGSSGSDLIDWGSRFFR